MQASHYRALLFVLFVLLLDASSATPVRHQMLSEAHGGEPLPSKPLVTTPRPVPVTGPPTSGPGCTTTVMGPFANPCHVGRPLTVYTSTTTEYKPVDCHGCVSVRAIAPIWGCPLLSTADFTTADRPATRTSIVCAATPTA